MRKYHVGLAVTGPIPYVRGRGRPLDVVVAPHVRSGFVTGDPSLADEILTVALKRSAYDTALVLLIGSGYGRYERPFVTTVGSTVPPGDLWAVVCYDERPVGLRPPPFVLFGDNRHIASLSNVMPTGPDPGSVRPLETRPPGDGRVAVCGFVPSDRAATETAALFAAAALAADLRF